LNKVEEVKILRSTEKGQIVQQQQNQNGFFRLHFHLSILLQRIGGIGKECDFCGFDFG